MAAAAAAALGLTEGPVHAELRVDGDRVTLLELAARSIGGLCSRALRFGAGVSLEEVILRHALDQPLDGLDRADAASGVMMLPIPRAGVLHEVRGQEAARAVPGVVGLEIAIARGRAGAAAARGRPLPGLPLRARGDAGGGRARAARRARGARGRHPAPLRAEPGGSRGPAQSASSVSRRRRTLGDHELR